MCFFIFHILFTPGWLYVCVYILYIYYYVYIHILLTSWSTNYQWLIWCFRYVQICFFKCIKDKVGYPKYLILKYLPAIKPGRWHLDPNSHQRTRKFSWAQPCPSCTKWGDEGHFGPQFMTFHRALLLKHLGNLGKHGETCRESLWWPNGTMWWCPSWFAKLVYNILYSGGFLK